MHAPHPVYVVASNVFSLFFIFRTKDRFVRQCVERAVETYIHWWMMVDGDGWGRRKNEKGVNVVARVRGRNSESE